MSENRFEGNVPDFLKMKRGRTGDSQAKVAERVGVSRPAISQVERGARRFKFKKIEQFSRAYQLTEEERKHLEKLVSLGKWVGDPEEESFENIPAELSLFYQVTKLSKEQRIDLMGMLSAWIQAHPDK